MYRRGWRRIVWMTGVGCLLAGLVGGASATGTDSLAAARLDPGAGPAEGAPVEERLVDPPDVPAPIHRDHPAHVIVRLETREMVKEIADGVRYDFWTFNGTTPGPLIRVREGDTVELHLKNDAASHMSHNIDLHAVMGPGGGAVSTITAPGHESVFMFRALRTGVFVYHCATAPVPMHIANGMYGLIVVEPQTGLPRVDHEYYVMQGDFYTAGAYHEAGLQPFDTQKLLLEQPTYVLFNGREGALAGGHALTSKVGETVRLFVGNGGPSLASNFHVIGGIFDSVNIEGGTLVNHNVQTTLIPAGGAAIVELSTPVPGTLLLVDHAITRAFMQGAQGQIVVSGPAQPSLYQRLSSEPSSPATAQAALKSSDVSATAAVGRRVFMQVCAACHQGNGMGLAGAFPPLAMSDYLNSDPQRAIAIVLNGLSGRITVNSTGYEAAMPAQRDILGDEEIAGVLTYVLNNFGNRGGSISAAEVRAQRLIPGATGAGK